VGNVAERTRGLLAAFSERTGSAPEGVWAGPGRINLIGEHTDYNDGFVLPLAIDRQVLAAAAVRTDGLARCWSTEDAYADAPAEVALDDVSPQDPPQGWAAYPLGVAWALRQAGVGVPGFDLVVDSDVPGGAGVSSSAALESAVALALVDLVGAQLSRPDLAVAGRRAENEIVGAPTGVMDQMAALCSREGHALFLDCRSLHFEQVPLDLDAAGLALLVLDTRTTHSHATGEYGERRRACEQAAQVLGVPALRDATPEQVDAARDELGDVVHRRARHVVTENERVLAAVDLLRAGDLRGVGSLLDASHRSMRDDFEISSPELDTAVEAAQAAGAVGARMTGGGFAGSAIALVGVDEVEAVTGAVGKAFADAGFGAPYLFPVTPAESASRVPIVQA